jgi:type I restriction enzyme R subunit
MLDLQALRLQANEVVDASLEPDANKALTPIDRFGANPFTDEDHKALSEIIEAFNTRHSTNFTDEDYIRFEAVNDAIVGDEAWVDMLRNNPPGVVRPRFNEEFMRRAIQAFQRDRQMQSAFMQDREAREMLMDLMFQRAVRGAGQAA